MHWSERLRGAMKQRRWTGKELSRRSKVDYAVIQKYMQGATDKPRGDSMQRMARALGVSHIWLEFGVGPATTNISVVGHVGAGEAFFPADSGVLDELSFDLGRLDLIAVQIRGTSALPVFRPGEVVIASRAASSDEATWLNQDCIVMTRDGQGYLKRPVKSGKAGRYTLISYNAQPIEDVDIDWAAPVVFVVRLPRLLGQP